MELKAKGANWLVHLISSMVITPVAYRNQMPNSYQLDVVYNIFSNPNIIGFATDLTFVTPSDFRSNRDRVKSST